MFNHAIMVAEKRGAQSRGMRRNRRMRESAGMRRTESGALTVCGRVRSCSGRPYAQTDRRIANSGDITERRETI